MVKALKIRHKLQTLLENLKYKMLNILISEINSIQCFNLKQFSQYSRTEKTRIQEYIKNQKSEIDYMFLRYDIS